MNLLFNYDQCYINKLMHDITKSKGYISEWRNNDFYNNGVTINKEDKQNNDFVSNIEEKVHYQSEMNKKPLYTYDWFNLKLYLCYEYKNDHIEHHHFEKVKTEDDYIQEISDILRKNYNETMGFVMTIGQLYEIYQLKLLTIKKMRMLKDEITSYQKLTMQTWNDVLFRIVLANPISDGLIYYDMDCNLMNNLRVNDRIIFPPIKSHIPDKNDIIGMIYHVNKIYMAIKP